jgi:hypothetical protein
LSANGYNPMRWECSSRGCYNVKHRPKIELFAHVLPGKIAFTDVDATTEVCSNFLFLEWKSGEPRDLPIGQRIYAQRLTELGKGAITYVVVCGDAETMTVSHVLTIYKGKLSQWEPCDFTSLEARIARWARKAKAGRAA